MPEQYVVLRNPLARGAGAAFESFGLAPSEAAAAPEVATHQLEAGEAAELIADPTVMAVTVAMPTTLIKPVEQPAEDAAEESAAAAAANVAWGVEAVGAPASARTGNDVVVAVLDTGIDKSHAAFAGVNLVEQDFSGSGNGDRNGHGTHCAGTIFGRDVDGQRIGIARGVRSTLIGKVLQDDGRGDSPMIFKAMQWAIANGANVISMSLGFDFPGMVARLVQGGWPADLATSTALEAYRGNLRMFDQIMGLTRAGAPFGSDPVVIAASGNESRREVNANYRIAASLPAASVDVVSVGAVQRNNDGRYSVARFSNSAPVLAGPGVNIVSAKAGGGLTSMNGTSMACPHVAGAAALWWEHLKATQGSAGGTNVQAHLRTSARRNAFASFDRLDVGLGLVACP